ncbi:Leucine Rich repeats (2 copies) [Gemmata obscuriglobus]|uniref:TIGR02996 domain-containing protein n=1 Tax=Gemmata obscuriglobus TaxID=114 RepID=A0A2Z3H8D6_9BACT|nr:TIGR02996 domain-containing protein [Gemmata obscuriglobus]AWM37964.1 TIGR02996 domain-containing protein [Gemmata obscuriglobus]QEG29177.1 Leucine Rich repeats (2 copies) [Gemmata obscuriglobus]VTS07929.1 repeat-companion domain-containing protein : Leucine-rich repeat-containing protein typical subtype OS=Herpetosiphon aurantiacus (strain ATCC 23779 / DSM 785) GN=Haur_4051 PE=4 SV=1: LRR_6: LRR_6: LRR_6: LRR_6: LRR_6: LRR_6: LRR_1 [Gemmata obscuriglobus UQM 2246]
MHVTDEQPFLDAVFERYADDGPRLVYADYLDDSGAPERAELIRVQLALARLSEDDPRRPPLLDRQVELLNDNRAAWTAHLAGLVISVDFRRGIPDSASVDAATFLERGDELFRRLRVRRLSVRDAAPVLPKLAACPLLAGVRELDLCNCDLGPRGLETLARSPHLKNLKVIDLGFNKLDDTAIDVLARSSELPSLTVLALNDNDTIGDAGVRSLAQSPFFAGLTALDLSGNDIGDAGAIALAGTNYLPVLRTVRLASNRIGDAGAAALARSPLLGRMLSASPELVLRANAIGHAGAAALAASPALKSCVHLDLSHNYLGDTGIGALLQSPYLKRLKTLQLARNQLTDAGLNASYERLSRLFDQLRALDLSCNRLTRVGLGILSAARGDRPVQIDVSQNVQSAPLGDAPVAVAELLPGVLNGVTEPTRLRQRTPTPPH